MIALDSQHTPCQRQEDEAREHTIQILKHAIDMATDPKVASMLWSHLRDAIMRRSPAQIGRMERMRHLN